MIKIIWILNLNRLLNLNICFNFIKTKAIAIYAIRGDRVLSSNLIVISSEESSTFDLWVRVRRWLIAAIWSAAKFTAVNHRCSLLECVFLVLISRRNLVLLLFCVTLVSQEARYPVLLRVDFWIVVSCSICLGFFLFAWCFPLLLLHVSRRKQICAYDVYGHVY